MHPHHNERTSFRLPSCSPISQASTRPPADGTACVDGRALDLAVADEAIKKNPARSKMVARPSSPSKKVVAWSDETVIAIIDHHPLLFRPVPVIGAGCDLRQGEIFGLGEEDLYNDAKVMHVRRQVKNLSGKYVFALPNGDKERVVPTPDWVTQTT